MIGCVSAPPGADRVLAGHSRMSNQPFLFAGLTPGYVGLYQVNVQLPTGVTPGNAVPVVVTTANLNSNAATIAVQ